jgi:GAF domain-containing protein
MGSTSTATVPAWPPLRPTSPSASRTPPVTAAGRIGLDAGAHSSLSVGLPLRDSVSGALNLYASQPNAFGDDAVVLAQTLAGYAAVAMANAP